MDCTSSQLGKEPEFVTSRPKVNGDYLIELATEENALFAFEPTSRIVPTTQHQNRR